jgi:hypothetical protein
MIMTRKFFGLISLAILVIAIFAMPAFAQYDDETPYNFGFEGGFVSKYVTRGIVITDGFCFQPDAWVGYGPFTFDVWANMDLDDTNGAEWNFSEVDLTLSYDYELPICDVTAGAIYYMYPAIDSSETSELFAGVSFPQFPFTPSLKAYYDIQEAEGVYYELGVGGTVGGTNDVTGMDWAAKLGYSTGGYNNYYYGDATTNLGAGLSDFSLEISRKFAMRRFYIKPTVGFSTVIDSQLRDRVDDVDNFWFGVFAGIEI